MRSLSVFSLIAVCFACSPGIVGSKSTEQPDISRSGSEFLEVCSSVDGEHKGDPVRCNSDAICLPRAVTTVQIVRVIKKYVTDNPDKAHHTTRYVTSLALAHAFSYKAGK
jgi:hypothetical protein